MIGYCLECGISHVMPDFPCKPTPKPQEILKIVEVSLASSRPNNSTKMVPMNVVMRAQKLKNAKVQIVNEKKLAESSMNSWKS